MMSKGVKLENYQQNLSLGSFVSHFGLPGWAIIFSPHNKIFPIFDVILQETNVNINECLLHYFIYN